MYNTRGKIGTDLGVELLANYRSKDAVLAGRNFFKSVRIVLDKGIGCRCGALDCVNDLTGSDYIANTSVDVVLNEWGILRCF